MEEKNKGYWSGVDGWIGNPIPWKDRNWWCKIGFHKWGAPWCSECGHPDKILQEAILKTFEEIKSQEIDKGDQ